MNAMDRDVIHGTATTCMIIIYMIVLARMQCGGVVYLRFLTWLRTIANCPTCRTQTRWGGVHMNRVMLDTLNDNDQHPFLDINHF